MIIENTVYESIMHTVGVAPAETGGILGAKDGVVCEFFFDSTSSSRTEYVPDTESLNKQIALWLERGVEFAGIVHSHPNEVSCLSPRDMEYAERIFFSNPQMKAILFPVVTFHDGKPKLTSHIFDGSWREEAVRKVG